MAGKWPYGTILKIAGMNGFGQIVMVLGSPAEDASYVRPMRTSASSILTLLF